MTAFIDRHHLVLTSVSRGHDCLQLRAPQVRGYLRGSQTPWLLPDVLYYPEKEEDLDLSPRPTVKPPPLPQCHVGRLCAVVGLSP